MLGKDYNDENLLTVAEAAAVLGVSTKTLRRWDAEGVLIPIRHPATQYRLYKKSQLIDFMKSLTLETNLTENKPRSPRMQITDSDIDSFVNEKVNIKREDLNAYRAQANNLIDNLEKYLKEDQNFGLKKMIHAGSCAKGTATSTTSDLDVAAYLTPEKKGESIPNILQYIRELLVKAMKKYNMAEDQFTLGDRCVRVLFKGSQVEVDVVPIIPIDGYEKHGRGWLAHRSLPDDWLETSPKLHLEFIRKRKDSFEKYAPFVRLTKWWKNQVDVPLKSFAIELIWAYLIDNEEVPASYCNGLPYFFKYILRTGLKEQIAFSDYYSPSDISAKNGSPITIYDPVNSKNNVTKKLTEDDRRVIVNKAQEAMNVLMMATCAPSKTKAIEQWRRIFGASFNPYS